jgi:hypothetical protein
VLQQLGEVLFGEYDPTPKAPVATVLADQGTQNFGVDRLTSFGRQLDLGLFEAVGPGLLDDGHGQWPLGAADQAASSARAAATVFFSRASAFSTLCSSR